MPEFLTGALVALAAEFATANVLLGMMLAWALTGGDGEPDNAVQPIAGLLGFVATIAAAVVSYRLLQLPGQVLAMGVMAIAATGSFWWLSMYEDCTRRRRLYISLAITAAVVPAIVGAAHWGRQPQLGQIAVAVAPVVAVVIGGVASPDVRRLKGTDARHAVAVVALLAAPALLLLVARTTA